MIFRETPLAGAWLLEPERFEDERGYFHRTFCRREFEALGIDPEVVQASASFNHAAGTLRGLHLQRTPHEEGKLVRCTSGSIYDAVVDLRVDSDSLGVAYGVELSAANGRQLFVPKGFGHGFLTLEDNTEVSYLMSEFYAPDAGVGYRYNDPTFAIDWPRSVAVISDKDRALPYFDLASHQQVMSG